MCERHNVQYIIVHEVPSIMSQKVHKPIIIMIMRFICGNIKWIGFDHLLRSDKHFII